MLSGVPFDHGLSGQARRVHYRQRHVPARSLGADRRRLLAAEPREPLAENAGEGLAGLETE